MFFLPILKIHKTIVLRSIKNAMRLTPKAHRTETLVTNSYTKQWLSKPETILMGKKLRMYDSANRIVYWRTGDYRKYLISVMHRTIASLQPASILELGSGVGPNVLALAILNPQIKKWTGVEMTKAGVETAKKLYASPPIKALTYLTEQDEQTIRERLRNASITFVQGNLLDLPFDNEQFDFAYSCSVFEQIPKKYPIAFQEASRVVKNNVFFIEEFKEAQKNIFQKLHLKNIDYFRASFREVEKCGLTVERFEPLPINNIVLNLGALLCVKNTAQQTTTLHTKS